MPGTRHFFGASHEEFPPEALLQQAVAAERAGFDGISASDHLQPWWEPGEAGHTWVWLSAAGHATSLPIGTGVTSTGARYHPAMIAQAWATLERMFPGRAFLGIGSGEALNEVPVGDEWPGPGDQIARMDEALSMIDRQWKGAQPEDHYTRDWHKPQEMYEHGEDEMSDEEFAQNAIVGSDPDAHVERLKELEELGATIIVLQNNSGADPMKAIEVYGEQVLPALRGARV